MEQQQKLPAQTLLFVAIDMPRRTLFTYQLPQGMPLPARGTRVIVPFGKRRVIGFSMGIDPRKPSEIKGLRDIEKIIEDPIPLFEKDYLKWLEFAAGYYLTPLGMVLTQALPNGFTNPKKPWPQQNKKNKKTLSATCEKYHFPALLPAQQKVADVITKKLKEFFPVLLHGITGSGKTEIYIDLIKKTLALGRTAIYLVPEIGLTPQTLSRLSQPFGNDVVVIHSALTPAQKRKSWLSCLNGTAKIILGTRSALFAPLKNLGLVVVDEEHDSSYKQEEGFRYHARDLAIKRAQIHQCPVILGSATPSLESWHLATENRFHYFHLPERATGVLLPKISIIDIAREREQSGSMRELSFELHHKIQKTLNLGRQVIVFVGQRGYAQCAFCLSCRKALSCVNCSVALKFHKTTKTLKCHYCAYEAAFSMECPDCHERSITLIGTGTQGIEEELATYFGSSSLCRMDADATNTTKKITDSLQNFFSGKTKILVGTQIISKGHDFANVGLVCITGIDAALGLVDFRSAERTFQNVVQVAGRAGRTGERGEVLIQSLLPNHPALQSAISQDYKTFAEVEMKIRRDLGYPPFTRLVQIRFLSVNESRLKIFIHEIKKLIALQRSKLNTKDIVILGPTEMPLAKIRGKYRFHLIFKIRRGLKSQTFLENFAIEIEKVLPSQIQYQIDVDPMSLL